MKDFMIPCIVCEKNIKNQDIFKHYHTHTLRELLNEIVEVSLALARYGEYA